MTDQKITLAFDPDQLAMIIDGLPTPTLVVDNKNGDVLHLNEEARSYFGFAHDDNSPRKGRDLVGDIERFKAYTAILEKNGEVRGFELTTKKVNGHFFTALVSGRKIFYGESSATLSTVIDITAQKVIETELERKGKLLEQAQSLAAVSGWEWFYDPEARTGEFQISERTATVLGWRPIARSVSSQDLFNLLHPDDLETLTKGLVGVKNKGAPFAFEFRIGDDLGDPIDISYRWVRALGDVTFSEDRLILSITGSVQDITESKNFERQIKETSTRLADSEARFRDYAEVSADWL
jgi:PAS domain S-box-containing protein